MENVQYSSTLLWKKNNVELQGTYFVWVYDLTRAVVGLDHFKVVNCASHTELTGKKASDI